MGEPFACARVEKSTMKTDFIMKIRHLLPMICIALLVSCSTPKDVTYLQDLPNGYVGERVVTNDIRVRPDDKISIVINSREPLLSELFNLPQVTYRLGSGGVSSGSNNQYVSSYTVTPEGEIDFPVLGKIHIAGMRRNEVADYIKKKLMSEDLVKDPVVTVEYTNTGINVLGEVARPGRYDINKDKITILEALSLAGDLTITGKRNTVLVTRDVDGKPHAYRVDLTNSHSLYSSPVYYLQPDDVIYVEPVDVKKRQQTVNGNNVLSAPFWVSVASLLTSVAVLIFK